MQVRVVSFQKHKRLSIVQFLTSQQNTVDYISGPNSITKDFIQVKEVSESGSVNNLLVFNLSDKFVFFMDGDILIGAKQNRVLNTSVLLMPNSKTTIPVSCVEKGRWSNGFTKFKESDYISPQSIRANKSRAVKDSLLNEDGFVTEQGEVWNLISQQQVFLNVKSPTSSLTDAYEKGKTDFDSFVKNFSLSTDANGIAIFTDRKLLNIDVFNRTDIYSEYFPKLMKSAAMEVSLLDEKENELSESEAVYKTQSTFDLLESIEKTKYPGVAAGEELRFGNQELTGFELQFKNQLIHLTALNIEKGKGYESNSFRRSGI